MLGSGSWYVIKIVGDYDTAVAWWNTVSQFVKESVFAPLILFIVGMAVFIWGARQSGSSITLPVAPKTVSPNVPRIRHQKKEQVVELEEEPTEEPERTFVTKPLTEILSVFHNRTELAGDQLFSKYKGQWISIEGKVDNVSRMIEKFNVYLKLVEPYEHISASTYFITDQENIGYLGKGDTIKLIGRISGGYETILFLDECELD